MSKMSFIVVALSLVFSSCSEKAEQPTYVEVIYLEGNAYDRGYKHGQLLGSKIRSLYSMLLETSILPYLNREHSTIADYCIEYQKEKYANGRFSYEMLLESGKNLAEIMEVDHPEFIEEMRGISDGSGVSYDKILILNTFADTMMAFRTVTAFIKQIQAPQLAEVKFVIENQAEDGIDNNGDGQTDDPDDFFIKDYRATSKTWINEYGPKMHASMTEVPTDAAIRFLIIVPKDIPFNIDNDDQRIDPDSIRIQMGNTLYEASDPAMKDIIRTEAAGEDGVDLKVFFTPPGGLPEASVVSLIIQAGDNSEIVDPAPLHARLMRDERITFTTVGYGEPAHLVNNVGEADGRTQPPAIAFGVRNSATVDGKIRFGHNFALIDSKTCHKHTVVFVHKPDQGKPYAVLGWSGVAWGFSGMNADGLVYMVNPSDTLNQSLTQEVKESGIAQGFKLTAMLILSGIPVGFKGKLMLSQAATVSEGHGILAAGENPYGWNVLLGDSQKDMLAAELDSDVTSEVYDWDKEGGGVYSFRATPIEQDPLNPDPENRNIFGLPWASEGADGDDLHIASHYIKNADDIFDQIYFVFNVMPQRFWATFFYRSLRAHFILGDLIKENYGNLDTPKMQEILARPELEDQKNSMNSVVFEPEDVKFHYAMGKVPATSAGFVEFDLKAFLEAGGVEE
jgi:hypothetical protein